MAQEPMFHMDHRREGDLANRCDITLPIFVEVGKEPIHLFLFTLLLVCLVSLAMLFGQFIKARLDDVVGADVSELWDLAARHD
ncbi:hypothetical protein E2562_036270 [Oryza meyeriana var. granulata]|uniref:CNNM transmembrane domain-containing protein n=1 Tax=Oryza meyeriana var. granulata TaxID=110450 RepID=A0A6G1DBD3_9ORYZ|nr:hypothetical protein E2562_036270 [Oryza meyeriana var. granulata]